MSFANKYNSNGRLFDYDAPDTHEYTDLAGLVKQYGINAIYTVNAIYVNKKGKFGDTPVIATDNELVNAPQHLMNTVHEIFNDPDSISMINRKQVGFKVYEYTNKYGINYGLEWVDLPY